MSQHLDEGKAQHPHVASALGPSVRVFPELVGDRQHVSTLSAPGRQ